MHSHFFSGTLNVLYQFSTQPRGVLHNLRPQAAGLRADPRTRDFDRKVLLDVTLQLCLKGVEEMLSNLLTE